MTIDEAIKILDPKTSAEALAEIAARGELSENRTLVAVCEEACLIAVEALERSRWIPCSERLPETSGDYLVCTKNDYYGTQNVAKRYFLEGINHWKCGWTNITHWQPLPKLPEKEEQNER